MTQTRLWEEARAKVNLFLHVGARRTDGYHGLSSLTVFHPAHDHLKVRPADAGTLTLCLDGPASQGLSAGPDNLVMRAAHAIQAEARALGLTGAGAAIELTKALPVASGLGGGSADAAATLRALNSLWQIGLADKRLEEIGGTVGSDVPVCVRQEPRWMAGRGEVLTPAPALPGMAMVLVNPGIEVATAAAFAALQDRSGSEQPNVPPRFGTFAEVVAWLRHLKNDLEAPAVSLAPTIGQVLQALATQPDCALARMSGSGASCFGLFQRQDQAEVAALALKRHRPAWWIVQGAV